MSSGSPMIFNFSNRRSILTMSKAALRSRLAMRAKLSSSNALEIRDCSKRPMVDVLCVFFWSHVVVYQLYLCDLNIILNKPWKVKHNLRVMFNSFLTFKYDFKFWITTIFDSFDVRKLKVIIIFFRKAAFLFCLLHLPDQTNTTNLHLKTTFFQATNRKDRCWCSTRKLSTEVNNMKCNL